VAERTSADAQLLESEAVDERSIDELHEARTRYDAARPEAVEQIQLEAG
jgi:hypothetical protein